MTKTLTIYKPIGKTPLEAIIEFKKKHPDFSDKTISYAGRLDPMAEGLLLLLVGDENKKRETYEGLKKTYEFSVIFGIETDSYDILGIPKLSKKTVIPTQKEIESYIDQKTATFSQSFPPFSSKTINGIPLYRLSRKTIINEEDLPKKDVTIYSFTFSKHWEIDAFSLLSLIESRISTLSGNFRQEPILLTFRDILSQSSFVFHVFDFTLTCSSGTYIRSIAHYMGKDFQTEAIALNIKRTAIGDFKLP